MRVRAIFLALVPVVLSACGDKLTEPAAVPIESTTLDPSLGVNLAASTKTASGLYIRDIRQGTGATIVAGMAIKVKYVGAFANGTVFDSSSYSFTIPGNVIRGWNEGLLGVKVGGSRQLVIPPSLGYGAQGTDRIPPNAVLVFTVEPQ
jgi:peptidylprolyl isomerase